MFNNKADKALWELKDKVYKLEARIGCLEAKLLEIEHVTLGKDINIDAVENWQYNYGYPDTLLSVTPAYKITGISIKKLQALLNEVIDHVYKENK